MTENASTRKDVAVGSYKITNDASGNIVLHVTSGSLAGKSAKIITTPPSAAYFNEFTKDRKAP